MLVDLKILTELTNFYNIYMQIYLKKNSKIWIVL